MGASKSEHFSERQNQLATITKALGHPARIAIIDYLLKVDSCICGDIVNELPLAQHTISQHLKELKTRQLSKEISKEMLFVTALTKKLWKFCKTIFPTFLQSSKTKNPIVVKSKT